MLCDLCAVGAVSLCVIKGTDVCNCRVVDVLFFVFEVSLGDSGVVCAVV